MTLTIESDTAPAPSPPGLTIRDFTPTDEEYAALAAVENACYPEYPGTVEEWKHDDATRPERIKFRRLVAELDGAVVGAASHSQFEGMYHPRRFSVSAIVHPAFQGRGIGRALYARLLEALALHDPLSARANVREDFARSVRFLADRGFVEDSRSWESRLDVATFDPAPFAGAEARAGAAGITFATMDELQRRDPDHRQKLYELDVEATKDEPHPEPITEPSRESYDGWVFDSPNYLPEGNFVALDGDRYVGMSTLRTSQADPTELYVGFTGVLRDYRGKGIAMALKLKTIAFAKARGIATIKTWNDSSNRPMLRINEALGFARQPAWISLLKQFQQHE
jgi:GNAT superfamily N-acetyltransferase